VAVLAVFAEEVDALEIADELVEAGEELACALTFVKLMIANISVSTNRDKFFMPVPSFAKISSAPHRAP
jgi:hypothetical protein